MGQLVNHGSLVETKISTGHRSHSLVLHASPPDEVDMSVLLIGEGIEPVLL